MRMRENERMRQRERERERERESLCESARESIHWLNASERSTLGLRLWAQLFRLCALALGRMLNADLYV